MPNNKVPTTTRPYVPYYTNKPYATPFGNVHSSVNVTGGKMPLPIAGLIGAGLSAGTGIFNAIQQGRANRKAYENQINLWNMNNAYNHPSEQMKRLREANLNPNLIYGSGSKSATGMSTQQSAPPVQPIRAQGNPLETYQNLNIQNLQTDNVRTQNNLMKQQEVLNTLKQKNETIKFEKGKSFLSTYDEILATQLSAQKYQADKAFWESRLREQDWVYLEAVMTPRISEMMSRADKMSFSASNEQKRSLMYDLENELKQMNVDYFLRNQVTQVFGQLLGFTAKR